jgi:hypothetical protein
MHLTSRPIFAALGGIGLLAGCQTGEPVSTRKTADPVPEQGQSIDPSSGPSSRMVKPDAATLQKFLSKREFEEPQLQSAETGPHEGAARLAKTAALLSCNIDYNQSYVLNTLPNKAWDSFAYSPFYNQTCGGFAQKYWLYTLPLKNSHYHLGYQDPWVCPDYGTPKRVGRYTSLPKRSAPKCEWSFGSCVYNATDPATLGRVLYPHNSGEWVKIYAVDANTRARKTFNLKSIYIMPNTYAQDGCYPDAGKIQLWVKKAATQQWWYWRELLPGYIWSPFPNDGADLDEIQITSPNSYNWNVDDIRLDIPY